MGYRAEASGMQKCIACKHALRQPGSSAQSSVHACTLAPCATGYKCNEEPLPDEKPVASVKDYGAVGDGSTDDTAAFVQAVEEAPEGVLLVPAGRCALQGVCNMIMGSRWQWAQP